MAMDGLPEGVSPSGRVPEQLLQAAPILKRRRRWNREVFAKRDLFLGFLPRGVNIGKEGRRGYPRGSQEGPRRGQGWGRASSPPGCLVVPPLPFLIAPEGSVTLIFNIFFPEFIEHF